MLVSNPGCMYYQEQNRLWNEMFVEYSCITTLFGVVSSFPSKYLGVYEEEVVVGGLEKYHFSSTLHYILKGLSMYCWRK